MLVLGVDPGLVTTGYGLVEFREGNCHLVREAGCVRPPKTAPLALRLAKLHSALSELIAEYSPTVMVLEDLFSNYKVPKTAILMGHARGVLCLTAGQAGIPVETYTATFVKRAITGAGHASKQQMQATVAQRLKLLEPPRPPDVADALALALAYIEATTNPHAQLLALGRGRKRSHP